MSTYLVIFGAALLLLMFTILWSCLVISKLADKRALEMSDKNQPQVVEGNEQQPVRRSLAAVAGDADSLSSILSTR